MSIPPDAPSQEKDKRVDWLGAALITVGLALITFVLGDGELAPDRWKTSCASFYFIFIFLLLC